MKNIHKIIKEEINSIIKEDGAASCGSVMQSGVGGMDGTNPSAGQFDTPLGGVQRKQKNIYTPCTKRSNDFKNGSMMMQHADDEKDVNKKKVNEEIQGYYGQSLGNDIDNEIKLLNQCGNYAFQIQDLSEQFNYGVSTSFQEAVQTIIKYCQTKSTQLRQYGMKNKSMY